MLLLRSNPSKSCSSECDPSHVGCVQGAPEEHDVYSITVLNSFCAPNRADKLQTREL